MASKSAKKVSGSKKPARAAAKPKAMASKKPSAAKSSRAASPSLKKAAKVAKPSSAKKVVSKKIAAKPKGLKATPKKLDKKATPAKGAAAGGKQKLKQLAKANKPSIEAKSKAKKEAIKAEVKSKVAKEKGKALKAQQIQEEREAEQILKTKKGKAAPEPVFEEAKVEDLLPPVLTDAEGRPYCKVKDCDQVASVEAFCRYHYLLLWKRIQVRRRILIDGKLERYVDELTARYPDKFLEVIRKDLLNEKNFLSVIAELEIDESAGDSDFEEEDTQAIEEVRTYSESGGFSDDDGF